MFSVILEVYFGKVCIKSRLFGIYFVLVFFLNVFQKKSWLNLSFCLWVLCFYSCFFLLLLHFVSIFISLIDQFYQLKLFFFAFLLKLSILIFNSFVKTRFVVDWEIFKLIFVGRGAHLGLDSKSDFFDSFILESIRVFKFQRGFEFKVLFLVGFDILEVDGVTVSIDSLFEGFLVGFELFLL